MDDLKHRLRRAARDEVQTPCSYEELPACIRMQIPESARYAKKEAEQRRSKRQFVAFAAATACFFVLGAIAAGALLCGQDITWIISLPAYGAGICALLGPVIAINEEAKHNEAHG